MSGPSPRYRPDFTADQIAACERLVRRHSAPQALVYRAKLALLLLAEPTLDNPTAGRRLGKHENWVRYWRRTWATDGFRLADRPGRGRKPAFPSLAAATAKVLSALFALLQPMLGMNDLCNALESMK
jgi:hypothetical protein